jgi:3-deoxy-D-manno-octulosonate 8-phosphate phosphatase (KDO 8-P phosphatase)
MNGNFKQRLNKVKAFVFDIDGVLTDGTLHVHSDNTTSRRLNIRDMYAISKASKAGFTVAIISYARDQVLRERFLGSGVQEVYLGVTDKEEKFKEFATVYQLEEDSVLYMGDDVPDLLAMRRAGVPCCPHDAAPEIRDMCVYISPKKGGEGCVRDVIEQVLRLNGAW